VLDKMLAHPQSRKAKRGMQQRRQFSERYRGLERRHRVQCCQLWLKAALPHGYQEEQQQEMEQQMLAGPPIDLL